MTTMTITAAPCDYGHSGTEGRRFDERSEHEHEHEHEQATADDDDEDYAIALRRQAQEDEQLELLKESKRLGKHQTTPSLAATKISKCIKPRKHPLYDNCELQAPNGNVMAYIPQKRMNWYLKHGLAEIVPPKSKSTSTNDNSESQHGGLAIRLTFEPRGAGNAVNVDASVSASTSSPVDPSTLEASHYYLRPVENVCVVCGSTDRKSFQKHSIVPYSFRRFYPTYIKSHNSYDVVQLCIRCHLKADTGVHLMMQDINREFTQYLKDHPNFAASVEQKCTVDHVRVLYMKRVREAHGATRTLEHHYLQNIQLPNSRIHHFTTILKQFQHEYIRLEHEVTSHPDDLLDPSSLHEIRDFCESELHQLSQQTSAAARYRFEAILAYLVDKERNERIENICILEKLDATIDQNITQSAFYGFSVRWRRHFLNYLHPQFLSKHWNAHYNDSKPRDQRTF